MQIYNKNNTTYSSQQINSESCNRLPTLISSVSTLGQNTNGAEKPCSCLQTICNYFKRFIDWILDYFCCKGKKDQKQEKPDKATLNELPDVLQQGICTYLDVNDIAKLSLVNKRLNSSAKQSLKLRTSLDLTGFPEEQQKKLFEESVSHSLLKLNLKGCKWLERKHCMQLTGLINLQELNLEDTNLGDDKSMMICTEELIQALPTSLEKLNLNRIKQIGFISYLSLKRLINLKELEMSETMIGKLAELPTSLEKLNLSSCRNISYREFVHLKRLVHLQELNVEKTSIKEEGFQALPVSLIKLNLSEKFGHLWPAPEDFVHLERLINLQELIVRNTTIKEQQIQRLRQLNPNLQIIR